MVIPYGFKSRLSHQEDSFIGILFLLRRSAHFEPSSAAPPCKNKEHIYAGMAELADALDSGSNGRKAVQVQVLLPAPSRGYKKDIARENPDKIGVFTVYTAKFQRTVLTDIKMMFSIYWMS